MTSRARCLAAVRGDRVDRTPVFPMLMASPTECRGRARDCVSLARGLPYLLSAGCEVPGETPDEVMHAFCEAAIF